MRTQIDWLVNEVATRDAECGRLLGYIQREATEAGKRESARSMFAVNLARWAVEFQKAQSEKDALNEVLRDLQARADMEAMGQ